jgi:hypothetical protein
MDGLWFRFLVSDWMDFGLEQTLLFEFGFTFWQLCKFLINVGTNKGLGLNKFFLGCVGIPCLQCLSLFKDLGQWSSGIHLAVLILA